MGFYGPDFPNHTRLIAGWIAIGIVVGAACVALLWWLL